MVSTKTLTMAALAIISSSVVSAAPDGGYPLGKKEYFISMPIDHFSNGG